VTIFSTTAKLTIWMYDFCCLSEHYSFFWNCGLMEWNWLRWSWFWIIKLIYVWDSSLILWEYSWWSEIMCILNAIWEGLSHCDWTRFNNLSNQFSSFLFLSFCWLFSLLHLCSFHVPCHHLLSLAFTCLHSFRLLSRAFLLSSSLKSHRFPFSFLLYQDPSNVRILYHKHRKLFIKSKSNRWLCRICYFDEFSFEICF
jgi:hypothetical protein